MVVVSTALLVVPIMALINPGKATGASSPDAARYVLFQGSYTTFDLKRKETNLSQAVFLLDSHTGEVKRYINKIDENGVYIETWLPTDLPPAEKRRLVKEGK
jgi:hypothetical protein